MNKEKLNPLYNEKGQVNDSEIARKMADDEEELRNEGKTQDDIDQYTKDTGWSEQLRKEREHKIDNIVVKLKKTLSPVELEMLKNNPEDIIRCIEK